MFVIDAIDPKAETDGLWFDFMGSSFKISSTSSPAYQKKVAKIYQPHHRKIEQGKLDPEIGQELVAKALAGNILTDWKDVLSVDGEPVKFNLDMAKTAIIANEDLRDFILETAGDIANFRTETKTRIAKK